MNCGHWIGKDLSFPRGNDCSGASKIDIKVT